MRFLRKRYRFLWSPNQRLSIRSFRARRWQAGWRIGSCHVAGQARTSTASSAGKLGSGYWHCSLVRYWFHDVSVYRLARLQRSVFSGSFEDRDSDGIACLGRRWRDYSRSIKQAATNCVARQSIDRLTENITCFSGLCSRRGKPASSDVLSMQVTDPLPAVHQPDRRPAV